MITSIKTLKNNKEYVVNALKCGYTNGIIEGFNNKIKVIKRISFGYRTFYNFRNRIYNNTINYNKKGGINYILIIYNLCRLEVSIFVNHTG